MASAWRAMELPLTDRSRDRVIIDIVHSVPDHRHGGRVRSAARREAPPPIDGDRLDAGCARHHAIARTRRPLPRAGREGLRGRRTGRRHRRLRCARAHSRGRSRGSPAVSSGAPGRGALVTVPQHPWLWSGADEAADHVRRYRRPALLARMRGRRIRDRARDLVRLARVAGAEPQGRGRGPSRSPPSGCQAGPVCAFGLKRTANTTMMMAAPTAGTNQMEAQSCVPSASRYASTMRPDANAPMK